MCVKFIRVGTHRKEGAGNGGRDEDTSARSGGRLRGWMTMALLELGTGLPQQPAACPTGAEGESSPGLTARFAEGRAGGTVTVGTGLAPSVSPAVGAVVGGGGSQIIHSPELLGQAAEGQQGAGEKGMQGGRALTPHQPPLWDPASPCLHSGPGFLISEMEGLHCTFSKAPSRLKAPIPPSP